MDSDLIRVLANGPKESLVELQKRIQELKSQNASILECVIYVKTNQQCSQHDAVEIVINSNAWIRQKEAFLQHQQDCQDGKF